MILGLKPGAVNHGNRIQVDEHNRALDHQNIFAIGECALHEGMIYGLVAPGYEMAEVVAANLCGGSKTFNGFDMSTKLKLIGVDVASFGDPNVCGPYPRGEADPTCHHPSWLLVYGLINPPR